MAAIKEGVKAEVNAKKILFYKWDEQRAWRQRSMLRRSGSTRRTNKRNNHILSKRNKDSKYTLCSICSPLYYNKLKVVNCTLPNCREVLSWLHFNIYFFRNHLITYWVEIRNYNLTLKLSWNIWKSIHWKSYRAQFCKFLQLVCEILFWVYTYSNFIMHR